jgi:transcriptional regulator with XRE-family HTH domain
LRSLYRQLVPRRPSHELLAENVRRIAQAKGVSFVFLASVAGISTERLLAIFSGEFDPDLGLINKLADGLGVALSDLFADTDPEHN